LNTFKIVVAGVGGQGTLLASRLLAEAAIKSGLHVKIGETYGMAQRGGPVMGHIQIGGEINNPQIRKGEADLLIGFEPAEAVRRGITYLKKDALALVNTRVTAPVEVVSGMVPYPDLEKLFGPIATNIVMLGAIVQSGVLPYNEKIVLDTLKESLRPQFLELNMKAFDLGKKVYNTLK
jgi:indolepyruvate ferredoxin oxidoreductase beta subunit